MEDHHSTILVLGCLLESGSCESGEISASLGFLDQKHVSMILLRCFRRGLVSRRPFKRGRVRGHVYEMTEKGAQWLLHKAQKPTTRPVTQPEPKTQRKEPPMVIVATKQRDYPDMMIDLAAILGMPKLEAAPTSSPVQPPPPKDEPPWVALALHASTRETEAMFAWAQMRKEETRRQLEFLVHVMANQTMGNQMLTSEIIRWAVDEQAQPSIPPQECIPRKSIYPTVPACNPWRICGIPKK